jgi:hypothetical protein
MTVILLGSAEFESKRDYRYYSIPFHKIYLDELEKIFKLMQPGSQKWTPAMCAELDEIRRAIVRSMERWWWFVRGPRGPPRDMITLL